MCAFWGILPHVYYSPYVCILTKRSEDDAYGNRQRKAYAYDDTVL